MKTNHVVLTAVVVGVLGLGAGYLMSRGCGASSSSGVATVDCSSKRGMGAVVSVKGQPLDPDSMTLDKKVAYLDLLRDFWTRRMSVVEEVALAKLAAEDKATPPAEPSEEQVTALYEANKKAFPATMQKEEILNNLRQMLRSQTKYRADAERRVKATREGALTYTAGVTCGPRMAEVRGLATGNDVVMVGSFFCPECRGNFGYVDRWLEDQTKLGKKVPFAHVAVVTAEGTADYALARAEICVNTQFADKAAQFLRLAHRVPSQASASEAAAVEALAGVVKEMGVDQAAFDKCMAANETIAAARKRVEVFAGLNPMSANLMLVNDRPMVMRRDRPDEIPNVIQSVIR